MKHKKFKINKNIVREAARNGDIKLLKWLASSEHADLLSDTDSAGRTIAHYAAQKGNIKLLEWLAYYYPQIYIKNKNPNDPVIKDGMLKFYTSISNAVETSIAIQDSIDEDIGRVPDEIHDMIIGYVYAEEVRKVLKDSSSTLLDGSKLSIKALLVQDTKLSRYQPVQFSEKCKLLLGDKYKISESTKVDQSEDNLSKLQDYYKKVFESSGKKEVKYSSGIIIPT